MICPVTLKQSKVWDAVNSVELVLVVLLQKVLFITKTFNMWQLIAKLGSSSVSALLPTILYAIGKPDLAKQLATALVCYALFSSIGKFSFKRRRPGTYHIVYSRPTRSMAAFPSRHSVCMTVLASFTPFKYPLICLMVLDRIMLGKHFLTDCLMGYLIGELAVLVSKQIDSMAVVLILLVIALKIWSNGVKTLAGTLPVLLAPYIICNPLLLPLVGVKFWLCSIISPYISKKVIVHRIAAELSTSIITLGIIYFMNVHFGELLEKVDVQSLISTIDVQSNLSEALAFSNRMNGAIDHMNLHSIF